jgi:hypothetical protein
MSSSVANTDPLPADPSEILGEAPVRSTLRLRPTETAAAIAAMTVELPDAVGEALRDLLSHHLAVPPASFLREARLGLVAQMVRHGEIVTHAEYEEERVNRKLLGEEWDSAETLAKAFGGWLRVLTATLHFYYGHGRAPAETGAQSFAAPKACSKIETVRALQKAHGLLDDWPTQWEYQEWRLLVRRAARMRGGYDQNGDARDPRLPDLPRIRYLFGSFDAAVNEAATF